MKNNKKQFKVRLEFFRRTTKIQWKWVGSKQHYVRLGKGFWRCCQIEFSIFDFIVFLIGLCDVRIWVQLSCNFHGISLIIYSKNINLWIESPLQSKQNVSFIWDDGSSDRKVTCKPLKYSIRYIKIWNKQILHTSLWIRNIYHKSNTLMYPS